MGQMEQLGGGNQHEHSNDVLQMARNLAQIQLAFEKGEALIPWVEKYAKDFDGLTKRDPHILDELAEKETHDAALVRVKKEIYH